MLVRHMPNHAALDDVFHAIANPTRRLVLERLMRGPVPVTELARPFNMSLPSFLQHIDVLERSRLVTSRKVGRVRTVRARPDRLRHAERWMSRQRDLWERRLDQLDRHLLALKAERVPERATAR